MHVWGGHSLSAALRFGFRFELVLVAAFLTNAVSRNFKVKRGGRECPPYMNPHDRNMPDNLVEIARRRQEFHGGCGRLEEALAPATCVETSVSIPAAAPCTPPTAPIIARFPSASFFPGMWTTLSLQISLAARVWRPDSVPWQRNLARRPVLQCRRHPGFHPATWDQILEIDPARRIARVQPGVVLDNLRNAAEKHHLTFAPDPATP